MPLYTNAAGRSHCSRPNCKLKNATITSKSTAVRSSHGLVCVLKATDLVASGQNCSIQVGTCQALKTGNCDVKRHPRPCVIKLHCDRYFMYNE